uniref:BHLH domain-containing protein n=1 Tax=Globodera pallida TaxID=36090 RepID=A0A183BQM7_GLOPA
MPMPFFASRAAAATASVSSPSFCSSASSSASASCLSSPNFMPWHPYPPPAPSNFDPSLICWDFGLIAAAAAPPQMPSNGAKLGEQRQFSSTASNCLLMKARATKCGTTAAPKTSSKRPKGGANRRYKTPSPQLLRIRRENANARERKRMNLLNNAYEKLRAVVPPLENGQKLSKFDTLKMAQTYINDLDNCLKGKETTIRPSCRRNE